MEKRVEKITTLHPQGKNGVNILKRRYDVIKAFILTTIDEYGEISFKALNQLAVESLSSTFDGKITWYIVTVKLDLEARRIIERFSKSNQQFLKLTK